jgi:hypothetical protein
LLLCGTSLLGRRDMDRGSDVVEVCIIISVFKLSKPRFTTSGAGRSRPRLFRQKFLGVPEASCSLLRRRPWLPLVLFEPSVAFRARFPWAERGTVKAIRAAS